MLRRSSRTRRDVDGQKLSGSTLPPTSTFSSPSARIVTALSRTDVKTGSMTNGTAW